MSYRQSPMSPRGYGGRRRGPVVPVVLTVVVLLVVGVIGWLVWPNSRHGSSAKSSNSGSSGSGQSVGDVANAFAKAWSSGNLATPTYARGVTGADTQAAYTAITKDLLGRGVDVTVGAVKSAPAAAGLAVDTATLTVAWTLPGGSKWTYQSSVQFTKDNGNWQVIWSPKTIQPGLGDGDSLSYTRIAATRATIFDGSGQPIVEDRPVVDIGVEPSKTTDAVATATALASALQTWGVDGSSLASRIKSAPADQFVEVITLREPDFAPVAAKVQAVPGVILHDETEALSPSHAFARAFVGTVGPVTKEIVDNSNGRYIAGDNAGLSGLEKEYDTQLGGTNGYQISIVHAASALASAPASGSTSALGSASAFPSALDSGAPDSGSAPDSGGVPAPTVVDQVAPVNGTPLHTTLNQNVQNAADAALSTVTTQPAALVAVRVSTGQVIAVSNGPFTGYDTGLLGQVPPGSAFKVVTTLGLLEGGFNVDTNVPCVAQVVVQGKTFHNYEGEAFGDTPFHTDFAKSCNSAFISLRSHVAGPILPNTAASLGIGACWSLGTAAFRGGVPTPKTDVDLAATSFGQGETLVSPVDLAIAAASVARGSYIAPSLVANQKAADCSSPSGSTAGSAAAGSNGSAPAAGSAPAIASTLPTPATSPLPASAISQLRSLMREVVTSGTATVLAKAPGSPVMAKTGTAEYGSGASPKTHAWMIGYQGDIAFAVYVQDGQSGGTVAGPLALSFLQNLAATSTH